MHLVKFLTDTQLQNEGARNSSSGPSPEAINLKFRRLNKKARYLIIALSQRYSLQKPLQKVEVILPALNKAMKG